MKDASYDQQRARDDKMQAGQATSTTTDFNDT
jgi:hypothetical protein